LKNLTTLMKTSSGLSRKAAVSGLQGFKVSIH
jgi:hypothetical protein